MQTYSNAPRATQIMWNPVPPEPTHQHYERYDWGKMREYATSTGKFPEPPVGFDKTRQKMLTNILKVAEAGDPKKLLQFRIRNYNSAVRIISQYRDICVIALYARTKLEAESEKRPG